MTAASPQPSPTEADLTAIADLTSLAARRKNPNGWASHEPHRQPPPSPPRLPGAGSSRPPTLPAPRRRRGTGHRDNNSRWQGHRTNHPVRPCPGVPATGLPHPPVPSDPRGP
jgi:hypothetical protein